MKKKTAYFAHSMLDYDTPTETRVREKLEKTYKVLCPNRDVGEKGSMRPYLERLSECDAVVALEKNGFVGRGVFSEVQHALRLGKPTLCYRDGKLRRVTSVSINDPDDWKYAYGVIHAIGN